MTFAAPLTNVQVKDNQTFALVPSLNINTYVLAANTAKTITFPQDPNGAKPNYAFFSYTNKFFARWDGENATIPVADTADSAGSEICPAIREIQGVSTVSVIASVATTLSIAYYF